MIVAKYLLNVDESYIFLHENDTFKEYKKFLTLIKRRAEGMPIE